MAAAESRLRDLGPRADEREAAGGGHEDTAKNRGRAQGASSVSPAPSARPSHATVTDVLWDPGEAEMGLKARSYKNAFSGAKMAA